MPIQEPNDTPAIQQAFASGLTDCTQSSAEAASESSPEPTESGVTDVVDKTRDPISRVAITAFLVCGFLVGFCHDDHADLEPSLRPGQAHRVIGRQRPIDSLGISVQDEPLRPVDVREPNRIRAAERYFGLERPRCHILASGGWCDQAIKPPTLFGRDSVRQRGGIRV